MHHWVRAIYPNVTDDHIQEYVDKYNGDLTRYMARPGFKINKMGVSSFRLLSPFLLHTTST